MTTLVDKITNLITLIDNNNELDDNKSFDEEDYSFPKSRGYCHEKTETRAKGRFMDKTVIITGGAGNFGEACAYRMASEGCNIVLWDIVDATNISNQIAAKYTKIKCKSYIVDVTNEDIVKQTVDTVLNEFNKINYLFNNAGYQGDFAPTHKYSVKDFKKVMDINVTGAFIVLKYVAIAMMKNNTNNNGCIVNTSSRAAIGAPPNMIAYSASKAAILHMTRIAAKDLAPSNIRVNSVSPALIGPGYMWKRQIELQSKTNTIYYPTDPKQTVQKFINSPPLKRYGSIDEVIGPVTFLFSDDASYLTGVDLPITGGMN